MKNINITETMLLDNLVREAIQRPSVEQIEKYGYDWATKNYSKIGDLKVHWQYARRTGDYRIAHYCNRSDADVIHAETNLFDENSPDGNEYLFQRPEPADPYRNQREHFPWAGSW